MIDRNTFLTRSRWTLGIVIFSGAILCWLIVKDHKSYPLAGSASSSENLGQTAPQAPDSLNSSKDDSSSAGNNATGSGKKVIRRRPYDAYLNQLCGQLTAAEEDRLIAESGGDFRVLLGLVFADSERGLELLRDALRKAPNDPLVHYAILYKSLYPGFDRLHSALELARLAPEESTPLYAAAVEAFKLGDRAAALAYLQESQQRGQSDALQRAALESAMNVYQLAGRPDSDARTRVLLANSGFWEGVTLVELAENMKVTGPDEYTLWGSDEATSLLINANQKILYTPGFGVVTSIGARLSEMRYLRAIAESPTARLGDYLPAPVTEMLASSQAEFEKLRDILYFGNDKPGIYQRLGGPGKTELIQRISRDGELSAYLWVAQIRPDIFHSADFAPQNIEAERWAAVVKQAALGKK